MADFSQQQAQRHAAALAEVAPVRHPRRGYVVAWVCNEVLLATVAQTLIFDGLEIHVPVLSDIIYNVIALPGLNKIFLGSLQRAGCLTLGITGVLLGERTGVFLWRRSNLSAVLRERAALGQLERQAATALKSPAAALHQAFCMTPAWTPAMLDAACVAQTCVERQPATEVDGGFAKACETWRADLLRAIEAPPPRRSRFSMQERHAADQAHDLQSPRGRTLLRWRLQAECRLGVARLPAPAPAPALPPSHDPLPEVRLFVGEVSPRPVVQFDTPLSHGLLTRVLPSYLLTCLWHLRRTLCSLSFCK